MRIGTILGVLTSSCCLKQSVDAAGAQQFKIDYAKCGDSKVANCDKDQDLTTTKLEQCIVNSKVDCQLTLEEHNTVDKVEPTAVKDGNKVPVISFKTEKLGSYGLKELTITLDAADIALLKEAGKAKLVYKDKVTSAATEDIATWTAVEKCVLTAPVDNSSERKFTCNGSTTAITKDTSVSILYDAKPVVITKPLATVKYSLTRQIAPIPQFKLQTDDATGLFTPTFTLNSEGCKADAGCDKADLPLKTAKDCLAKIKQPGCKVTPTVRLMSTQPLKPVTIGLADEKSGLVAVAIDDSIFSKDLFTDKTKIHLSTIDFGVTKGLAADGGLIISKEIKDLKTGLVAGTKADATGKVTGFKVEDARDFTGVNFVYLNKGITDAQGQFKLDIKLQGQPKILEKTPKKMDDKFKIDYSKCGAKVPTGCGENKMWAPKDLGKCIVSPKTDCKLAFAVTAEDKPLELSTVNDKKVPVMRVFIDKLTPMSLQSLNIVLDEADKAKMSTAEKVKVVYKDNVSDDALKTEDITKWTEVGKCTLTVPADKAANRQFTCTGSTTLFTKDSRLSILDDGKIVELTKPLVSVQYSLIHAAVPIPEFTNDMGEAKFNAKYLLTPNDKCAEVKGCGKSDQLSLTQAKDCLVKLYKEGGCEVTPAVKLVTAQSLKPVSVGLADEKNGLVAVAIDDSIFSKDLFTDKTKVHLSTINFGVTKGLEKDALLLITKDLKDLTSGAVKDAKADEAGKVTGFKAEDAHDFTGVNFVYLSKGITEAAATYGIDIELKGDAKPVAAPTNDQKWNVKLDEAAIWNIGSQKLTVTPTTCTDDCLTSGQTDLATCIQKLQAKGDLCKSAKVTVDADLEGSLIPNSTDEIPAAFKIHSIKESTLALGLDNKDKPVQFSVVKVKATGTSLALKNKYNLIPMTLKDGKFTDQPATKKDVAVTTAGEVTFDAITGVPLAKDMILKVDKSATARRMRGLKSVAGSDTKNVVVSVKADKLDLSAIKIHTSSSSSSKKPIKPNDSTPSTSGIEGLLSGSLLISIVTLMLTFLQ